jgi:hypothetical protein
MDPDDDEEAEELGAFETMRARASLLSVDLLSDGLTVSACHAGIPTGARVIGENQPRLALRFLLCANTLMPEVQS